MKTKRSQPSEEVRLQNGASPAPPAIRNILATTDFSRESLAGVRYAVSLAHKLGASLALLHVLERPSWMSGMEATPLAWDDAKFSAMTRQQLQSLAERESKRDVQLTPCLRTGKPFQEICLAAGQQGADLLILATHGYTGARHLLLGSTAERVVRHAPCPVLTVRTASTPEPEGKTPPLRLKKILVPVDFSTLSLDARVRLAPAG